MKLYEVVRPVPVEQTDPNVLRALKQAGVALSQLKPHLMFADQFQWKSLIAKGAEPKLVYHGEGFPVYLVGNQLVKRTEQGLYK